MNLRLSNETAQLLIVIVLTSTIPITIFTPQIPATLIFLYAANIALLIYALYQLNLHLNPESEDPVNAANRKKNMQLTNMQPVTPTATVAAKTDSTPEQRSAQEIITEKLEGGAIEKAIDKQFDAMVQDVVKDVFGSYGGVSSKIKEKLRENMNPYIEQYDFAQHNVKLELLLNSLVQEVTKEQTQIIKNTRTLLGLDPINEITTEAMFKEFSEHAAHHVDTDKLEVDTDDEPSYEYLKLTMSTTDERTYSKDVEYKTIEFTCEQDSELDIKIQLRRWTDIGDGKWHISAVTRPNRENDFENLMPNRVSDLNNAVSAMKQMDELDIFFVKLHQDRAAITINEEFIEDDEVEVDAEPDISFS